MDFVIEDNLDDCPWQPKLSDNDIRPGPDSAERPSPVQEHLIGFGSAVPATLTTTPPGEHPTGENSLGSRSSQYSEYSYPSYPELNIGMPESPAISKHFPLLPPTPTLSSLADPDPSSGRRESNQGGNAFSPHQHHRQASLSPREAFLLRYYVERISPWVGSF